MQINCIKGLSQRAVLVFTSYLLGGIDFTYRRRKGWKMHFSGNDQTEKLVNKQKSMV